MAAYFVSEEEAYRRYLCPVCSNQLKRDVKLRAINIQKHEDGKVTVYFRCPVCGEVQHAETYDEKQFNQIMKRIEAMKENAG